MPKPFRLAIVLAVVAACSKSPPGDKASPGDPSAKPAGGLPAPPALQTKLHAGIECLNTHSAGIFDARKNYLEQVDRAKGPEPGKQLQLIGMYAIDPCRTAIKAAVAATPAIPELDEAATAYLAALEAVMNVHAELKGYYTTGDFKLDAGKKGTETHAKLMAAFDAFAAAHDTLDARIGVENRKVRVAALAAREKAEGRKLGVVLDSLMLEAETLVETISVPTARLLEGDAAALEAKVAVYAKAVDEFGAYINAHADEAQAYGSRQNLINYSQAFLGATRTVVAKVTAKTEPAEADVKAAIGQYNSLVDNYNR